MSISHVRMYHVFGAVCWHVSERCVYVYMCVFRSRLFGDFSIFFFCVCVMRGYLYIDLKCACMYQGLYMCGFVCVFVCLINVLAYL
jgi:hypothetical protein